MSSSDALEFEEKSQQFEKKCEDLEVIITCLPEKVKVFKEKRAEEERCNIFKLKESLVKDVRKLTASGEMADLEFPVCKVKNGSSGNGNTPDDNAKKGDIIEILDSDDGADPNGAADVSNVGKNQMKYVWSPTCSQRSKQNRINCVDDLFTKPTIKRKRNMCTSPEDNILIHEKGKEVLKSSHDRIDCSLSWKCGEETGPTCDSQNPLEKINGSNDELIFELNEKINELENQNMEIEGLVGDAQEKCKHFDTMVEEMGKEIEELEHKKSAAINTVKELRQKQLEADKVVEELKCKNIEANSRICGLSWSLKTAELYKMESDKEVEQYKRKLEKNLLPKIMNNEVGDLSNLVNDMHMLASPEEGRNLDIPGFNGSTPVDVENVVVMSRGMNSTSNVTGDRASGLSKKGGRNLVQPWTRKNDDAHTVKAPRGTQSGCNPPGTVEDNEHRDPRTSGNISKEVSSDDSEDESFTDSKMDDLVASLRSKHLIREVRSEADMLRAFEHDDVLCMNAVCALYRQNIFPRISKRRSRNKRFIQNKLSGCALAEYLIDGDQELRLRKSASEVKKEHPDVIGRCRLLATVYAEKLFQIYCAAGDPFFGQS